MFPRDISGLPVAHRVPAPRPRTVLLLAGVVQDATAQRRLGAGRVVFHGVGEDRVEVGEVLMGRHEGDDRLRLGVVCAGGDVDQPKPPHQGRMVGRQAQRRHATQRHADHRCRLRGMGLHHPGDLGGEHLRRVVLLRPPVGVAVPRQVDRQQRPPEGEGDRVPGVGVLRPAVQQHQLGRSCPPPDGAHGEAVGTLDIEPLDRRNDIDVEPRLGGVVGQHRKLVVGLHRTSRRRGT